MFYSLSIFLFVFIFLSTSFFNNDKYYGFAIFLILLLPLFLIVDKSNLKTVVLAYPVLALSQFYYFGNMNPIFHQDSIHYYDHLLFFNSLDSFWSVLIEDVKKNFIFMSIWNSFGVFVIPFYSLFNSKDPSIIMVFNTVLLFVIYCTMNKILKKHFTYDASIQKSFVQVTLFFLITSASLSYWSAFFLKDTLILSVSLITLLALLEKRYILFIILSLISYTLRPYSIIPVLCYYVVFKKMKKSLLFGVAVSMIVVLYASGLSGLINTINTLGTMFLSPNPFALSSWVDFPLRTIESLLILITLILSIIVYITNRKSRFFYNMCYLSLFIYSCVLTLISYDYAVYLGMDYGIGVAVDDLSRKKLMVVVLIFIILGYSISNLQKKKTARLDQTA